MKRDGVSGNTADELIAATKNEIDIIISTETDPFKAGEDAAQILQDFLNLEPDYLDELIW